MLRLPERRKSKRPAKIRRRRTSESGWGRERRPKQKRHALQWVILVLLLAALAGVGHWMRKTEQAEATVVKYQADDLGDGIEAAEKVVAAFLAEADPAKRLQWVRHPEQVSARFMSYPEDQRMALGKVDRMLGHQTDGGRTLTGFVVSFPSGNLGLLEVVGTPDGPRVDWDAFARYGTASWDGLLSGEAERAQVRVFCQPSTESPAPFDVPEKWTPFSLTSPDLPQGVLGFTQVGSVRDTMMKQVVLGTPNYRQRFTLEILRHEGKNGPLFEITRCIAVGWVTEEQAVEELWSKQAAEQ